MRNVFGMLGLVTLFIVMAVGGYGGGYKPASRAEPTGSQHRGDRDRRGRILGRHQRQPRKRATHVYVPPKERTRQLREPRFHRRERLRRARHAYGRYDRPRRRRWERGSARTGSQQHLYRTRLKYTVQREKPHRARCNERRKGQLRGSPQLFGLQGPSWRHRPERERGKIRGPGFLGANLPHRLPQDTTTYPSPTSIRCSPTDPSTYP